MTADNILNQLTEGTVLAGPHWTEPVKVLTAKARGSRIEVQAVGMHTKRDAVYNHNHLLTQPRIRFLLADDPGAGKTIMAGLPPRDKGDTQGMAQCLGQRGQANNPTLWLVAQAISEILPDDDKEKQLMQGLLNQWESLEAATRQRALF